MDRNANLRRRWLGAMFLTTALLMLIAGETVLAGRLNAFGFAVFWSACLVSTCGAIVVALRDLSETRRRMRDEHRTLFAETLNNIARSSKDRSQHPDKKP